MKNRMRNTNKIALIVFVLTIPLAVFAQGSKMIPRDGSTVKLSKYSLAETVDILQGAIEGQNLMVIFEIDAQKMLRMAGKKVKGMRQIFYFHPKYMRKVMEVNKAATIQIPLKFIVMEKPEGTVVVKYFMPSKLLGAYRGEEAVSRELDGLVSKIVHEITN